MSFADRFRKLFRSKGSSDLRHLEPFATQRKGVEGYVEPQTATSPVTLLLVDRDGDHLRAPVRDAQDAARFCERFGIPLYDAQVIGYPKRMREFERGRRAAGDSVDEQFDDIQRRLTEGGDDRR